MLRHALFALGLASAPLAARADAPGDSVGHDAPRPSRLRVAAPT
jgi:hypothetical protein